MENIILASHMGYCIKMNNIKMIQLCNNTGNFNLGHAVKITYKNNAANANDDNELTMLFDDQQWAELAYNDWIKLWQKYLGGFDELLTYDKIAEAEAECEDVKIMRYGIKSVKIA
jgi:hypothetical protein